MNLQQLRASVRAPAPDGLRFEDLIALLHGWIRDARLADLVPIDVGDYRHLRDRPRVLLVTHAGHLAIERAPGEGFTLSFTRKRDEPGPAAGKLGEVQAILRRAGTLLEGATDLRFDWDALRFASFSRLTADTERAAAFADAVAAFVGAPTDVLPSTGGPLEVAVRVREAACA